MQKVLIDIFLVPEQSRDLFLARARAVQSLLKTLPGFVEGFPFEKKEGTSRYNYMTTAVWETAEALENAAKAAAAEFKRRGFDPQPSRNECPQRMPATNGRSRENARSMKDGAIEPRRRD
jgi:heme-degrading monooxygenase HmoA